MFTAFMFLLTIFRMQLAPLFLIICEVLVVFLRWMDSIDLSKSPKTHPASQMKTESLFITDDTQADKPEQPGADENRTSWFQSSAEHFLPSKATVAREWINRRKEGLKPWREFISSNNFTIPKGIATVGQRLPRNIDYFQSNYLCVFLILVIYCILTSPMLLFALVALFGMLYVIKVRNYQKKLSIGGKELSPAYQYAVIGIVSFPLFYIAGAGSAIFWVIGASMFFIVVHALFYASEPRPEAGFIDVEEV